MFNALVSIIWYSKCGLQCIVEFIGACMVIVDVQVSVNIVIVVVKGGGKKNEYE